MKKKRIYGFIFVFVLSLFLLSIIIQKKEEQKKENRVIGTWYEESGMLFKFTEDTFYWYKDFSNITSNYYKGKIEIKQLCDFHMTKEQIKKEYGTIDCKDYYEIKLYPQQLVSDEKKEEYKGEYALKFAMYFEKKNTVYLYDFNKNKFYTIAKINNF